MTAWRNSQLNYWNAIATQYDDLYAGPWSAWEDAQTARVVDRIPWKHLEAPRVLDLGCGTGFGFEIARRQRAETAYLGIDISAEMIAQGTEKHPGAQFRQVSMTDFGSALRPRQYDVVLALNGALSYSEDPAATVRQALTLAPATGQYLVLSVISRRSVRRLLRRRRGQVEMYSTRGDHGAGAPVHVFTEPDLAALLSGCGATVRQIVGVGMLAGVFEHRPAHMLDAFANRTMPDCCHALIAEATFD